MVTINSPSHTFTMQSDPIEYYPLEIPDDKWVFVDKQGHIHQWEFERDKYEPERHYELPTLKFVVEIEATDEYPAYGHYECVECGEYVKPKWQSNSRMFYLRGLTEYLIDDESIIREVFEVEYEIAKKQYEEVKNGKTF